MRLAELTTMRVGGQARRLIELAEPDALIGQVLDTWASGEPWLILGGGSNLIVSDEGFDGTVIKVATRGIEERAPLPDEARDGDGVSLPEEARDGDGVSLPEEARQGRLEGQPPQNRDPAPLPDEARDGDRAPLPQEARHGDGVSLPEEARQGRLEGQPPKNRDRSDESDLTEPAVILRVQAGENWDDVVAHSVQAGLRGIEALSGIPGLAGAAPVQNIGAYGQELSDVLVAIDFVDFDSGELERVTAQELALGYRTSALKRGRRGLVVALELALRRSHLSEPIRYPQLASALGRELGDRAPLAAVRDAVIALRASKGMVLSPDDPDSVSAGSFFTNPIVSENFARGLPDDAPRWLLDPDAPTTQVKLSAAWLIERSGIRRGFALPGSRAAVSSKHTLAIVNRGDATAEQVAELARYIQLRVLSRFGVLLQPEPQLLGVTL